MSIRLRMSQFVRMPWLRRAETRLDDAYRRTRYRFRRAILDWRVPYRPKGRKWGSGLSLTALQSIQAGAFAYSYRGIPMVKNPFEVALYQLLFWQLKPRSVIEIGTHMGASA